jgi:hypothetical protein
MRIAGCFTGYRKILLSMSVILPLLAVLVLGTPVLAAPMITLTPASGAIGTRIVIDGTNFDSYKGDNIYIFFDDTEITDSPLKVPDTGAFSTEYYVPAEAEIGRHWIYIYSDIEQTNMLAKGFFIVEETMIQLDTVDGPTGTDVTISGLGFYADRTVTISYYDIIGEKLGTVVASPTGEFSYNLVIPLSTAGEHKITAANAEGNRAEATFEVIPVITLSRDSAGPGELLTVTGTGFGHRSDIIISFGARGVATARTDDFGSFEVDCNVPEMKPNLYDVKAEDEEGNLDKAKFTITAGAKLNQTAGAVGSRVTIEGSGFAVGGTITIDYDKLRVGTTTADNNGAFNVFFDIPPSIGGEHVITISDGTTTKQFAFTIESEAPPVPRLLLPANSSETRAEAYMDWADVIDPSTPVIYSLQIASDHNFSSIVLDKGGLAESEYILTEEEQLAAVKQGIPYYWRVKARDSANNESEWSAPWTFFVSAPPAPVLQQPTSDMEIETPIFFNWQSVTSLSPPITYNLQVATDLNFTAVTLEKTGLLDSEYLMPEEEELPELKQETPYYWRVKAIDSASNESEWSSLGSFYVGSSFSFPGWAIGVIIAVVVIIVGFIAFRVGRRTAFHPPE